MANYRTVKLLTPYKGYSICRIHKDGEWYYSAHEKKMNENSAMDYYVNIPNGLELYGCSLKEIKRKIDDDVNAAEFIRQATKALTGRR